MTELAGPLLLVGCGKMGGALLHGWLHRGLAARDALVVERDAGIRERIRVQHGVHALAGADALPADLQLRALVSAIKPQAMAGVLPAYRGLVGRGGVLLSIAAGTTIARFEAAFGERTPIVLGFPDAEGRVTLINVDRPVPNGARMF